ncbi:hypothetical protein CRI69_01500 [Escherichia sp. E4742]|nr:hypothetical protein FEM44_03530 [Escherichia sp. E4742]TGB62006.1 hypothetical protein CRI69_01500 [Escherichia sp. E4742]TLJ05598.1 hypothetical protein FEK62_03530 [Escherichia sp. E4742]
MIPELIISGEDTKGEFLTQVPGNMPLCSVCVMTMKQDRKITSVEETSSFRAIVPFKIKL